MNGRNRTVSDNLDVKGTYILDMFNEYLSGLFYVNRKYQRKLVWTLEEKQAFVDTILHKYPVPIFLIVKYRMQDEDFYRKDIIDGLQRFNAIFSFVKNEFGVKCKDGSYCYFNTSALAGSEQMIKDGGLKQRSPILGYQESRDFLNYQLPITTTEVDDSEVEEIFRRINSTGRKLSKQDLRQAGAVGLFSDLVRKTSCYIRGDISEGDLVKLSDMPALSLSGSKLDYGINLKECFWIRNGIITEKNIRISRDEEIIARLYGYMLLGESTSPSSTTLDRFYDASGTYHESLNDEINSVGLLSVMDTFSKVIADFEKIFKSQNSNFNSILFKDRDIGGKAKVFQAMFLSLYELTNKNLFINNYESIAKALMGIGTEEFREITNDEEWNVAVRNKAIRRFKSIMEPLMIKKVKNPFADNEWKLKLETQLLCASGSEKQMYDFKLGITNLKDGGKNKECISNFIRTLTAMANTNPQREGIIIIGIANNKSAAEDHKKHYNSNWIEVNHYFITGIDSEIKKYWNNDIDNYCNYIKQVVSNEPIQEDVKSQILRNFEPIEYQGKTLFIITCKNTDHSFTYNKEFYERYGSHTEKVEIGSSAFNALIERTTKK